MPNNLNGEQCVSCGAAAAVRVTGTSFCASCGLRQHGRGGVVSAPLGRRSHRAAALGILSSGILVKMLMGAVALAAVGGVTASLRSEAVSASADPVPAVTAAASPGTTVTPVVASTDETIAAVELSNETGAVPDAVHEYVLAVQAWAECVAEAATAHSGGAFDPHENCLDYAVPGDFGLDDRDGDTEEPPGHDVDGPGNSENAPGHDVGGSGNSENAPGHDDEAADDDDPDDEEKKDKPPREKDE